MNEIDARDRQARFRHICRQHDAPQPTRLEHPLLLCHAQPREQRQHFRIFVVPTLQRIRTLADLALARQENEGVAHGIDVIELIHPPRH